MNRLDRARATGRLLGAVPRWWLVVAIVAGCAASPAAGSSTAISTESLRATASAAPVGTPSPSPTAAASPMSALVGQWELNRTCQAIVDALTKAGHPELIPGGAGELVQGNING